MTPTAKGVRTSEGQLTFLAILGAVIAALVQLPTAVQAVAIVSAAAVAATYTVCRTHLKAAELAASVTPPRADSVTTAARRRGSVTEGKSE